MVTMETSTTRGAWGFSVRYGESPNATSVQVHVGTEEAPDEDHQLVFIDDQRLPFDVRANVWEGQMTDVEFVATPGSRHSLEQKDLRTAGVVSLVRTWAQLGRDHQLAQRFAESRPSGLVELPAQGAADTLDDTLEATRSALSAWLPAPETAARRRLRGRDADELLERVARRYQELVAAGHPKPRVAIAAEVNYTPQHIGRLLVKARRPDPKTGRPPLLGPARPGRAGERAGQDDREES